MPQTAFSATGAGVKSLVLFLRKHKATKAEITEIIKIKKIIVQTTFTDKVNLFKEELTEKYFLAKQTALDDYPIFMAIAEDIGYDATGRNTNNNELTEIEIELAKFITHINKTEK